MDTVDDLGEVLLLIQISEFKDETLRERLNSTEILCRYTYLGKANYSDKVEKDINVVRMSKVKFGSLSHMSVYNNGSLYHSYLINPPHC